MGLKGLGFRVSVGGQDLGGLDTRSSHTRLTIVSLEVTLTLTIVLTLTLSLTPTLTHRTPNPPPLLTALGTRKDPPGHSRPSEPDHGPRRPQKRGAILR